MAKKAKEETMRPTIEKKSKAKKSSSKKKKAIAKNTKENRFDFNEEIIIGVTKKEEKKKPKKKIEAKKKNKPEKEKKSKTKIKTQEKTQRPSSNSHQDRNYYEQEISISVPGMDKLSSQKHRKADKEEKEPRKKLGNAKRKSIFKIIRFFLVVGVLITALLCLLLSPFFNIKSITVQGNEKISKEEILSLAGIPLEQNTFKILTSQITKKIKQNPYIDTAKIHRKLPDEIEIVVKERKATYCLPFANAYVYLNNQGYMLEISSDRNSLPMLTGFITKEEEIKEGNRLCVEDLQRLGAVLQIMEYAVSNSIGELVTRIDISDKQDYILELENEKKTIHMGDTSNLSTKMLYIIEIINKEKGNEGEIFVNSDLNNKGATFRKKV